MKKTISLKAIACFAITGSTFMIAILINVINEMTGIPNFSSEINGFTARTHKERRFRTESNRFRIESTPNSSRPAFSCKKIFYGDDTEATAARKWVYNSVWTDTHVRKLLGNCSLFKKSMHISEKSQSSEEREFPLAFTMIIAENPEQFLRLFAAIYQPQNIYCLTYDEKATFALKQAVVRLADCFENVILPYKHEAIYWGTFSVLQAALNCLQLLTEQEQNNWKYHQIVSWNDVPLKTNLEMVRLLQSLNGSSDSELKKGQDIRYMYYVDWVLSGTQIPKKWYQNRNMIFEQFGLTFFTDKNRPKPPTPGGLTVYKGSFAATLSRSVAEFIIRNELIRNYTQWLNNTFVPDESLWATVLFNREILKFPTLMDGKSCLAGTENCGKRWISRYQLWPDSETPCHGKWVHGSCALGVKDLPKLRSAPQLFAHKMYLDFEPAAFFCMLQLLENRTKMQERATSRSISKRNVLASMYLPASLYFPQHL